MPLTLSQTFKPNAKSGYKNDKLESVAKNTLATLGSGSMAHAVKLPKGEDVNEWLAVNTVDFFNELNLIYGTISQFCSKDSCPCMNAGDGYKYLWQDSTKYTSPTELSAPEYVEQLMDWAESQLNDESIFPLQIGQAFPKDFKKRVSTLFRRFFRVYAHIYHSHIDQINSLSADAPLNTCFKHFIYFVLEFQLIDAKELGPLQPLIDNIVKSDNKRASGSGGKDAPEEKA